MTIRKRITLWGLASCCLALIVWHFLHPVIHRWGYGTEGGHVVLLVVALAALAIPVAWLLETRLFRYLDLEREASARVVFGDPRGGLVEEALLGSDELGDSLRNRNTMVRWFLQEQALLQEEKEHQTLLTSVLREVSGTDTHAGLCKVLELMSEHLQAQAAWLLFVPGGAPAAGGPLPEVAASHALPAELAEREEEILLGECVLGKKWRDGYLTSPLCLEDYEPLEAYGLSRILLGIPIGLQRGKAMAVFVLREGPVFTAAQEGFLSNFAGTLALAMDRSILLGELSSLNENLSDRVRQRNLELEILNDLWQSTSQVRSLDELFEITLEQVHEGLSSQVEAAVLENHGRFLTYVRRGAGAGIDSCDHPLDVLQEVYRRLRGDSRLELRPRTERFFGADPYPQQEPDGGQRCARLECRFQAPLLVQGSLRGAILSCAEGPGPAGEEAQRFLSAVAFQTGQSVERIETALLAEHDYLERLITHLPQGVFLLDQESRITVSNPLARKYLDLLGTDLNDEGQVVRIGGQPLEKLLAPSRVGEPQDLVCEAADRRIFELSTGVIQAEGQVRGHVFLLADVTEERERAEKSQQHDRLAAVGQLAAGIAHDFNNLLTGIIGYSELLETEDVSEAVRTDAKRIMDMGLRASQLVRQILDFSRKSVVERQPVDLVPFLKENVKMLERTMPESIRIRCDPGDSRCLVNASLTQMQQVLTNLAVNARDAMPGGGELGLSLAHATFQNGRRSPLVQMPSGVEWVVLAVSDTGTGIPPDVLDHIFEPFFTTKERGHGTGLGLAQVFGIVKQHDGFVDVQTRPGEGTTFRVYLPSLDGWDESEEQEEEEAPRGEGETILVAEDEDFVRQVTVRVLEGLGYRVLAAVDGREAARLHAEHADEIDLVLTDVVMPQMGAQELVEVLAARGSQIPIVAMSGYPLTGDLAVIRESSAAWLQKPLKRSELARALRDVLVNRGS